MYAMELSGAHVGRKAKFTWQPKSAKKPKVQTGKIHIVHHHSGGRVSIKKPYVPLNYYSSYSRTMAWDYLPAHAEVEFLD